MPFGDDYPSETAVAFVRLIADDTLNGLDNPLSHEPFPFLVDWMILTQQSKKIKEKGTKLVRPGYPA